jgi:hypothetical protein
MDLRRIAVRDNEAPSTPNLRREQNQDRESNFVGAAESPDIVIYARWVYYQFTHNTKGNNMKRLCLLAAAFSSMAHAGLQINLSPLNDKINVSLSGQHAARYVVGNIQTSDRRVVSSAMEATIPGTDIKVRANTQGGQHPQLQILGTPVRR